MSRWWFEIIEEVDSGDDYRQQVAREGEIEADTLNAAECLTKAMCSKGQFFTVYPILDES